MQDAEQKTDFVRRYIPWLLMGAMALVYCFTLSRWITFTGVSTQAQVFGWDWRPGISAPLYFLLTYPLHWLPGTWQIPGLNCFSAVCALWALGLLARSVTILPYDRTRDLRELETHEHALLSIPAKWAPPALAVAVCGLQLTFWDHAVSASLEGLDLLLFAYVVWELLEFRLDGREVRIIRLALVYGLSIANNYAMIAFAPAFLVAIIWIMGWNFFNVRFLIGVILAGLVGLCLYFVLPVVHSLRGVTEQNFWEILRVELLTQKNAILQFPRFILPMIGLTSLFPVFFMGIKWPHHFGDVSAVGTALTNLMTHVMHGVFLLACLYVAFDPAFSPRRLGGGYALLPFYYLGALSIGYFSGYFLMVFAGGNEQSVWQRSSPVWRQGVFFVLRGLVWVALVGVPAGLVWQNLPKVRVSSSDALNRLGELTAQALPPQGAVVLSDDLPRLYAVQATLAQLGTADKYLFVQTKALPFQAYHRYLRRTYGTRWPLTGLERPPGLQVDDPTLVEALDQVSRSKDLYYLHPSFGYYFERFYSQPHHLVYPLARYPTNVIEAPLPAAEALQDNDRFWQQLRGQELTRIIKLVKKDKPKQVIEASAAWLGMIYSRSANYLGVEYQRSGNLAKAAEYFALGLELNPDSPICYINAEFNKRLRAGKHEALAPDEEITRRIAAYQGDWNALLNYNGPVDEPNSCYLLGQTLAGGGNNRQSAQQYLRVLAYEPENFETRITLAATLATQFPDQALETITQTRALVAGKPAATNDALALLQLEAWAYAAKNDLARAEKILLEAQVQYPKHAGPFSTLAEIYVNSGRITNAMMVLEKQLRTLPEDANTLANYAALKIRTGKLNDAIPYLDKALKLEPRHPYALLNRAIAFLQIGKADDAERDYSTLERLLAKPPYAVYYGLGEVAKLKKNRKEALKYYEQFIQRAPPGAPEINYVREQIRLIKSGKS